MGSRRPPEILRKSHAHSEGKPRERGKQALRLALDESAETSVGCKALLIDLDGVVYTGDERIPGATEAIEALREFGLPHLFVTNTTSRPREAIVTKLAGFGIDVGVDEILAPPDAAADWLAAEACKRLLLAVPEATAEAFSKFETTSLDQIAAKLAVTESPESPAAVDAVVVGDLGAEWNFDRLNAAFRCLMGSPQPKLIALGMTRYWHAADGLRLDTAPFVAALSHASGVEPIVLGKPARAFFDAAIARLGARASSCWMVGDDIKSDVGGAQTAGLKAVLVKTGKFRRRDLALEIKPDLVLDSIADLHRLWEAV